MKSYLVGFSIAVIAAIALYFFYIVPERGRIQEKIDAAYYKGYEDCYLGIDTVFLPSEPEIIIRDTTIFVEKPAKVVKQSDSVYYTASSIDTSIISGKDEINLKATVGMELNINKHYGNTLQPISNWFIDIVHKELECIPDTVILKVPKIIERTEVETNWLYVLISFLTGGGIFALLALL